MPALFNRIKTWVAENLTNEDLNAEIDNILNNFGPQYMDDVSTNVSQMQEQVDPGDVGTESLATSLFGELARIRFELAQIKGENYWYSAADTSLSELANAIGTGGLPANRISSGRERTDSSQTIFLVPAGNATTVTVKGASTAFVYFVNGTQYTISSDVSATGLLTAPATNNTAAVNDTRLNNQQWSKLAGEYDTYINIDAIGSEISALNTKLAAFKINDGASDEYFIARVDTTNNRLRQCRRGYFFDSTDAPVPRIPIANNDTITLMRIVWVFARTIGTLAVTYNEPTYSKDQPSAPSVGDYWFDMDNNTWKTFDSVSWMASNSTLIGIAIQDTTNCVAARSGDIFANVGALNTLDTQFNTTSQIIGKSTHAQLNVYGNTIKWESDLAVWDITTDRESGVTEDASTHYYLYVDENGDEIMSNTAPYDRRQDLFGYYHPHQIWRCVGETYNNASSDLVGVVDILNHAPDFFTIVSTVASNAMTVNYYNQATYPPSPVFPLRARFRSTSGATSSTAYTLIYYPVALTVPSGATLGMMDNQISHLYLYLQNIDDNVECGIVQSLGIETSAVQTSTAIGTGADNDTLLYTTTGAASKPTILIGRITATWATAGTYNSAPTSTSTVLDGTLTKILGTSRGNQSIDTVYYTPGDIIVHFFAKAAGSTGNQVRTWEFKVAKNSTPTTQRIGCHIEGHSAANNATSKATGFSCPVLGGYYYTVVSANLVGTMTMSDQTVFYITLRE